MQIELATLTKYGSHKLMRKLSFLIFLSPFFALAQPDSSFSYQTLFAALSSKDINESIYNGKQHLGYPSSIIGNPYYQTQDWQHGSIIYHDIFYPDIVLKYDLVQNEIIIKHEESAIAIELFTPWLKSFSMSGKKFFLSPGNDKSLPPFGIYEEIITGKINLYIYRSRYIKETIRGTELDRHFEVSDLYYAVKDGHCYSIKKPKALWHLVIKKKSEIKKDLKRNDLRLRNDYEAVVTEIISYYNKTTR